MRVDTTKRNIEQKDLYELTRENLLTYAKEVTLNRAYPSLEDGLKPAQRAILLTLYDLTYKNNRFVKSAGVCGMAAADYHPHDNKGLYRTAMLMANQPVPLIDVQGSKGSIATHDIPADRYTNLKLSDIGREMFSTLEYTEKIYNYNGTKQMPRVLLPRFPYCLMTDSVNIAFGTSSVLLPFNPVEIMDAMKLMVEKDGKVTTEELMEIIKGPDLRKGHRIYMQREALRSLIEEGHGLLTVVCDAEIEGSTIIIKECPWREKSSDIYTAIAKRIVADRGKEPEIKGVIPKSLKQYASNETDIRMKVDKTSGLTPREVLAQIYANTNLKKTYNVELIFKTKDDKIELFSIRSILDYFIKLNYNIIRSKYEKQLEELKQKLFETQVLEKITRDEYKEWFGKVIFSPRKKQMMKQKGFTDEEISIIFSRNILNRLSDRPGILKEIEVYQQQIEELQSTSDDKFKQELLQYIDYIKQKLYRERQSKVYYTVPNIEPVREVEEPEESEEITPTIKDIYITEGGYIACVDEGADPPELFEGDKIKQKITTKDTNILIVMGLNQLTKVPVHTIPDEFVHTSRYTYDQTLTGAFIFREEWDYVFVSSLGGVKYVPGIEFRSRIETINGFTFDSEDEKIVAWFIITEPDRQRAIDIITKHGFIKRLAINLIPVRRRVSRFAIGTKLEEGDEVVDARLVDMDDVREIEIMTEEGIKIYEPDLAKIFKSPYVKGEYTGINNIIGFVENHDIKEIEIEEIEELVTKSYEVVKRVEVGIDEE